MTYPRRETIVGKRHAITKILREQADMHGQSIQRALYAGASGGLALIQRDGQPSADSTAYPVMDGFEASVGDPVLVLRVGKGFVVIGRILTACSQSDNFAKNPVVGDLGLTEQGTAWADDAGFDIVTGGYARPNNVSGNFPGVNVGFTDMAVECAISNMASDPDCLCGVNYRKQNATNFLAVFLDRQNSLVVLIQQVAGVNSTIAQTAWIPTDSARLKVVALADRHRVYVDGVAYIDTLSTQFNGQTNCGLFAQVTTSVLYTGFCARPA